MQRWLLPLQSLLLAVALTWPLALHADTAAIGSLDADGTKHVWTLWWMQQEWASGVPGLHTTWVNFPDGMDLFPIEPLNGLVALALPLPPVLLSNLLALVHLTLLGVAAGWLGGVVSESRWGAATAGALAQGCAFAAFTLHVGVGELRQYWWIPLGLGCLVRARETGGWRWFLALGGALAGAVLSCFYHGLFLAVAVTFYALLTLRLRPRLLLGYTLAAALAILVVWPVVRTFAANYGGRSAPQPIFGPDGTIVATYQGAAMQVQELFTPRRGLRSVLDRQAMAYTGGRYLGLGTLALVVAGAAAAPRKALPWLGVALGCVTLSLGSVLWWNDGLVRVGGAPVALPLAWLNDQLGRVAEPINFPARFVAPAMIALAVTCGLAVARWRVLAAFVPLAVADMAWNDLVPWPRATFTLPDVGALAAQHTDGAYADLQLAMNSDPEARTQAIAAQIALRMPSTAVPIERQDTWAADGTRWVKALPLLRTLRAVYFDQPVPPPEEPREVLWLLRDRGITRVMLTHRATDPDRKQRVILESIFGRGETYGHATLFRVPPVDATADEATRWRKAQEERVQEELLPELGPQFPGAPGGAADGGTTGPPNPTPPGIVIPPGTPPGTVPPPPGTAAAAPPPPGPTSDAPR